MMHKRRLDSFILITLIGILFATSTVFGQAKFLGKGHVKVVRFSVDGEWLAIGTTAVLEVYSIDRYQPIFVIDINVNTLDFSPDGTEISVVDNQTLHQFEIPSGREITRLEGHESRITDVAYSPAGNLIASVDEKGIVRLWREGHQETSFRGAASSKFDYWLLFSPDGRQLHVGTSGHVQTWDVAADVKLANEWLTRAVEGNPILHPDGKQLVFGKREGRIEFWSSLTAEQTRAINIRGVVKARLEEMGERANDEAEIESLELGPNGRILVIGFKDAVLAVWDTHSQSLLHAWITKTRPDDEFKGWGGDGYFPDYDVRDWDPKLALSPDGRTVVAAIPT